MNHIVLALPEGHAVNAGLLQDLWIHQDALRRADAQLSCGFAALTRCERVVALHVKFGLSNKEVAARLGKCEATVKNQVAALLRKLGVPSRTRLVALLWALDLAASQRDEAGESIVVCGSSVRRLAAEECLVGRAAAVRRPASLPALAFA